MPAYTLQALRTEIKSESPWLAIPVSYEPMTMVHATGGKVWRTGGSPVGSLVVYDDTLATLVEDTDYSVVNTDTGVILFVNIPVYVPLSSYDIQEVGDGMLLEILRAGFQRMQSIYPRALYLYDSAGTLNVSSSSTSAVDPVIGTTTFSVSDPQRAFLKECCLWILAERLWQHSILESAAYREERTGGLAVDTTRNPSHYESWVNYAKEHVAASLIEAREEYGDTEDGVGYGGPHSDGYYDDFDRLTGSEWARGVKGNVGGVS